MVYNRHVRKEDMLRFISALPDLMCGAFWGFVKVYLFMFFGYWLGLAAVFGMFYFLFSIFL